MYHSPAFISALLICEDPKRAQAVYAALGQFVTPDLVLKTAPDLGSALAQASSDSIDLLLLCGDGDSRRQMDLILDLRSRQIDKPVLVLAPPSELRRCLPLVDGMGLVESVHFSVVRAGLLSLCAHELCRRQRQAEDFAELLQRCTDLEAENHHLHRKVAELTRQLEAARHQAAPRS